MATKVRKIEKKSFRQCVSWQLEGTLPLFYLCNTRTFLANSLKNYCQLFNHVQNPSSPGKIQASISVEMQHESEVFEGNQTASGEAPVLPTCRNDL